MSRVWKRITAMFLALVMVIPTMPAQTYAAMDDDDILASDTAYDEDIDPAKEDMEVLEAAGIADETGSMVDLDIREDGNSVELSELTNRIASGKTVGAITVNGNDATPEQILKIGQVQSELELAKLLDQDIEITDEHVENLESLITGIADGSIDMDEAIENGVVSLQTADEDTVTADGSGPEPTSGTIDATDGKYTQPFIDGSTYEGSHEFALTDPTNTTWYSDSSTDGLSLDGVVTLSVNKTSCESSDRVIVTAKLNKPQPVPVSFDWNAVNGSASLDSQYSGTVEWDAGESGDKWFAARLNANGDWVGSRVFVMNAGNIKNATFADGKKAWSQVIEVPKNYSPSTFSDVTMVYERSEFTHHVSNSTQPHTSYHRTIACSPKLPMTVKITLDPSKYTAGSIYYAEATLHPYSESATWTYGDDSAVRLHKDTFNDTSLFGTIPAFVAQREPGDTITLTFQDRLRAYLSDLDKSYLDSSTTETPNKNAILNTGKAELFIALTKITSDPLVKVEVTASFPPNTADASVSVPAGTYYSGEVVPITVTLSNAAVLPDDAVLMVNGTECKALDQKSSNNTIESTAYTFGYTVKDLDTGAINVTKLTGTWTNSSGMPMTINGGNEDAIAHSFGVDDNVRLVSDVKNASIDCDNVKYGISDGDAGDQVVTVVVPFKSGLTDADKAWVTNEAVQINTDSSAIDLPVPDYSDGKATHYLAGAYFSIDGGATRYPVYIVNSGTTEGVALAGRFMPPVNEDARLRKDTLNLFMDPQIVNGTTDATKYLPSWSDMKTDEKGFAYADVSGKDTAPALIGLSVIYYVKGGAFFEKKEDSTEEKLTYITRPTTGGTAAAADQTGVMEGFLKRADGKYIVLQDKDHPENQYDVEIVVGQDFYDAMNDSMRAESPKSMTLSYQYSNRKSFTFVKPKDFEWICYRIVENNGKTELVEDKTSFEIALDKSTPENGTDPGIWKVIPTGLGDGRFCFWLKVRNGTESKSYKLHMVYDEDGNAAFGKPLTVTMGKDPFLTIPEYSKVRSTLSGEDTDILFASNVAARNAYAGKSTTFTAKMYEAEADGPGYKKKNETVLKEGSVTSTGEEQINRYTIPGDWINNAGIYAVELGTKYVGGSTQGEMGDVTGSVTEEKTLTATAYLIVKQAPAKIMFNKLDSYSVTNDKVTAGNPLALGYTVSSGTSGLQVQYTIQKSGEEVGERKTASGGSISFTAGTPASLKEAYTITAYARNREEDPWSVDSMLLTVYNKDLLDIIVRDVTAGEIGGTTGGTGTGAKGTTIAMDNHTKVANYAKVEGKDYQLSFEDFTTLRTDMSLQKIISANYGSGVWGMLSDKMQWESSDPATVSVDYKQGGIYSDIRNYSYVSYAPATDFLLVGKDDTAEGKEVKITATHANTGLSANVIVKTKTLTNELYVFQFNPKTTTTVTYKNGKGETRNLTSNDKGELAVYEPEGINNAIMATSTVDSETYVGTLYPSELESGERDVASLQLYPCNNLRLRAIANAELNIIKPDGQPYDGSVTVRGGVYKNGFYCPGAKIKTAKSDTAGVDGKQDISATASNGKLNLWFDPRQFNINNEETDGLKPGDTVTYVIEYRMEGYQPGYVILNAYSDLVGAAKPTDSVIQLRSNVGDANLPQITRQTLQQYDKDGNPTSYTRDVIDYTEDVGISAHFNKAELVTDVAMPDAEVTMDDSGYATCSGNSISSFAIYTTDGKKLTGQTEGGEEAKQILKISDLTKYTMLYVFPFSSTVMGRGLYTITDENLTADGITDSNGNNTGSSYSARVKMHFTRDGLTTKEETLSFGISNLSHQKDLSQSDGGAEELGTQVKSDVRNTVDIGSIFKQINVNDMIRKGFVFLQGLSGAAGDNMMNMMILPTEDPATFRIMVFIGYNKKEDREQNNDKNLSINYDANQLYDDAENFEKELDEMLKDDDDDDDDDGGSGEGSLDFNFYGTLMLDARLGISDGNWDIRFVGGDVGTNVEGKYEWSQNFMCGPVPCLISFEVGFNADIEVAFGDKKGTQAMLLDAALGVSLEAFAGLGFDLSLIEFKLGIFGKIGADVDFLYLVPANKTGTKLDIDGEIGLRMEVKALFVTYKKTFCSTGFGWSKKWGKYDAIKEAWESGNVAELSGFTSSGRSYNMQLMPNGTALVEIDGEGEIENRDYLELAERAWNGGASGGGGRLLRATSGEPGKALNNVETNAYPYANPVFADDGSMFLYISDNNNADELQSVVSYAVQSGGSYENKGALVTDESNILADSDVVASGSGSNIFAAWVKQQESPEKEMKDKATYDDLGMMMNATEVYAGVYDSSVSSNWVTTRLTDNTVADMSPTIASYGDRAIVAWRSLAATELPEDGTEQDITASFNAENNINYRIYNGGSSLSWNEVKVAYNGAAGTVNAIDSAMLSDGTALLTYTVRTGEDVTSTETFYTLIGTDGEVVTTGRLTNNETTDTNAQVSAVGNQFVVGWYSEYETGEESEVPDLSSAEMRTEKVLAHDISLARINGNGSVDVSFPESIGGESGSGISSDFRFSAPAGNMDINKLSVVWSEKNEEDQYELNAVRFYTDGDNIGVTTKTDIAKTGKRCSVDRFDTFTGSDGKVYTLILCSDYSSLNGLDVYDTIDLSTHGLTVLDGNNDAEPSDSMLTVLEQDPLVNILLGSGTFTQKDIEVETQTDLKELTPGLDLPVQFAVKNVGTDTVDSITASIGTTNKTFNDLSLLPGQSAALVMEYPVPETVTDVDYTVTAEGGSAKTGTLVLNRPDVGISGMKILNEIDRKRDIQVTLHNRSGIPLAGSGKKVKLAFYKDSVYSEQIGNTVDISEDAYADIDGGFGTYTQSINVSDIIGASTKEIPDEGVNVYVRAWVEEADQVEGKPVVVEELYPNDNESMISFKGLKTKYQTKLTMDGVLIPGDEGKYTIQADVRNNSLQTVYLNEIRARILDVAGNQIGEDIELSGEMKLNGEERKPFTKELSDLTGVPATVEIEAVPATKLPKPKTTLILKNLINYETGKFITVDSGIEDYEFYAGTVAPENSDEETGTTATNANVNVEGYDLLTNIVDKANTNLYVRAKTEYKISDWVKIPLPGRQNTDSISADYATDRLIGVRDGVWFTTDGTEPTDGQYWNSKTHSTDLTKAPVSWDGTEKTLKFKIPGDQEKQVFESAIKTVTLGAKGTGPSDADLDGLPISEDDVSFRTAKLPVLKGGDETAAPEKKLQYRYRRFGDSEWSTWGSVSELIGLDIATTYDLELRYAPETDNDGKLQPASQALTVMYAFTTKTTTPDINDILDRWIDYKDMKFQATGGVLEYALEKDAAGTQVNDGDPVPSQGFYLRYRAGNGEGGWTYVDPVIPNAIYGVTASDEALKGLGGKLKNTSSSMEYRYKAGNNTTWTEWTAGNGPDIDKLPPGTYQIRNKNTGLKQPSFARELTIAAGPSATVIVTVKDSSSEVIKTASVKAVPVEGEPKEGSIEGSDDYYTIRNLSAGTYSIIVIGEDGKQVTTLVDITSENASAEVILPTGTENSSKLVDNTGFGILAGGIDEQARAEDTDDNEYLITFKAEEINASAVMSEEEGQETETGDAVRQIMEETQKDPGYMKDGKPVNILSDFMDLSMEKTLITSAEGDDALPGDTEKINKTQKVMEIIIPYPQVDSRFNVQVRRYHDGKVENFNVLKTRPASGYRDRTYFVDRLLKRLHIYSDCYSVYSISYTEDSSVAAGEDEDFGIYFDKLANDPYEGVWYNSEKGRYEIVYTGYSIKPLIRARSRADGVLREGIDYTVSYSNNKNVSKKKPAAIKVEGRGYYKSKKTLKIYILPADIGKAKDKGLLIMPDRLTVKKGNKITPAMVYRGHKLDSTEYTLSNKKAVKADTSVTITGKGNYTGSISNVPVKVMTSAAAKSYKIKVRLNAKSHTYNGKAQELKVTTAENKGELTVTAGSSKVPLKENKDFVVTYSKNVGAGKARVMVTGIGDYMGCVVKTFKIKPDKKGAVTASLSEPDRKILYNVRGATPDITVTISRAAGDSGKPVVEELVEGRDYKLRYSKNKKVGTGVCKVIFKGNYKGHKKLTVKYKINPAPITDARVEAADLVYGKPDRYRSKPYVSLDGVRLWSYKSNFTYKYYIEDKELSSLSKIKLADNENEKTVTIVVKGKGNYSNDTVTGTYKVIRNKAGAINLNKAKIVAKAKGKKGKDVKVGKKEYTGSVIEPEIRVMVKNGKKWTDVDPAYYKVCYINNINKGTAVIMVNGNGTDAIGGKTAEFKIVTKTMSLFKLIF